MSTLKIAVVHTVSVDEGELSDKFAMELFNRTGDIAALVTRLQHAEVGEDSPRLHMTSMVLTAKGADEDHLTETQRALFDAAATVIDEADKEKEQ